MSKKETKQGGGVLGGFALLLLGIGLLWYNEGRTVANQSTINEARKNYQDVKCEEIDSNNEGRLVATKGKIDLSEAAVLVDSTFDISAKAAKLVRTVEVYQWEESCTTDENDNKTCTYEKKWHDGLIDSSGFSQSGHDNPTSLMYDSESFVADNVKLGAFYLPEELIKSVSADKKIGNNILTEQYKNNVEGVVVVGNYLTNVSDNVPKIGDIRISYAYLDEENVSVMAVQRGASFEAFTSKKGIDVYKILKGNYTGAQILEKMTKSNNNLKWILRAVGVLLLVGAFSSIFSIITNLTDKIPLLGKVVSGATGLISGILGFALSLIVIAIAWFRFRPILSIVLLAIVVALVVFLKYYLPKIKKDK